MRQARIAGLHGLELLHAARAQPLLALAAAHDFQSRVVRFPLPVEIQQQQYQFIRTAGRALDGVRYRTLLYLCLRCHEKHPTASGNMRLVHGQSPLCVHCLSNAFTVCVQTLGCIVRVRKHSYYFCRFCAGVHAWTGNAETFFKCTHQPERRPESHACVVCYRPHMVSPVSVFDNKLGVRSTAWLCARHLPPAPQLAYVHDVESLRQLLKHKYT